jgi:hypothetical protein
VATADSRRAAGDRSSSSVTIPGYRHAERPDLAEPRSPAEFLVVPDQGTQSDPGVVLPPQCARLTTASERLPEADLKHPVFGSDAGKLSIG